MARKKTFDRISVSVDGKRTMFKVGDFIKFNENDIMRCITKISIDSDGCVSYLMTFLHDNEMISQWFTESDFRIMAGLEEKPTVIGFK